MARIITAIIPDIHDRILLTERVYQHIRDKYPEAEIVFTGDYFDSFGGTVNDAIDTATWVKKMLDKSNVVMLVGNHDMPYQFPSLNYLSCPGWTVEKHTAINSILSKDDWKKFKPIVLKQNFLISHAGVNRYYNGYKSEDLVKLGEEAYKRLETGSLEAMFIPGFRMGGRFLGGITWLDWREEFTCLSNVNQIVGHSTFNNPQTKELKELNSTNYCIDTCNRHYALIIDGIVELVKVPYDIIEPVMRETRQLGRRNSV